MFASISPFYVLIFNFLSCCGVAVLVGRRWWAAREAGGPWLWMAACLTTGAAVGLSWVQVALLARVAVRGEWSMRCAVFLARFAEDSGRGNWFVAAFALVCLGFAVWWRNRFSIFAAAQPALHDDDWPVRCDVPYGVTNIPPHRGRRGMADDLEPLVTFAARISFWLILLAAMLVMAGGPLVASVLVWIAHEWDRPRPAHKRRPKAISLRVPRPEPAIYPQRVSAAA